MFSTVKKLACVAIILCALNITVSLCVISYIYGLPQLEMAQLYGLIGYTVTTSFIMLAVSCALFSACTDVNVSNDYMYEQFSKVNKRLEALEKTK